MPRCQINQRSSTIAVVAVNRDQQKLFSIFGDQRYREIWGECSCS